MWYLLNITNNNPLNLEKNTDYTFSLMGVSEDNWVNMFSVKPFVIQD